MFVGMWIPTICCDLQRKEEVKMHSGRVQEFLKNHHDDVDGLLLEDGFQTHFPPHIGHQVIELLQPGDNVDIEGRNATRPKGEVVYEATQIHSHGETIVIDRPGPPHGKKGKRKSEQPMSTCGTIVDFHTNHHEEVDGFTLSDETEVKFPPHLGESLKRFARVGDEVRVDGRRHEIPHGDIHLHADRIIAVGTGETLDRHSSNGHDPAPPRKRAKVRDDDLEPSNAELMIELKAIRKLIESQCP